jgi:hypothetical protein
MGFVDGTPVRRIAPIRLAALIAAVAQHGCGGQLHDSSPGDGGSRGLAATASSGSSGGSSSGGNGGGSSSGSGSGPSGSSGSNGSSSGGDGGLRPCLNGLTAADCPGCTFPCLDAPPCASSAPAIELAYPPDGVLVPPNLNTISVQWTPHGSAFTRFEVDFRSPPNTDWRIITSCRAETLDAPSGIPTGGCELVIDPVSWSRLVSSNRGASSPIAISVRGTTDGACASVSTSAVHLSIAEEDVVGAYYYWKSTISPTGAGGQIWAQRFGDLNDLGRDVTSSALPSGTCNGCHVVSRDATRMLVYSDDGDSDDEYGDLGGSLLDLTTTPGATELSAGVTAAGMGGQPPGFGAFHPLGTPYVTSNGLPLTAAGAAAGISTSDGYPFPVPSNGFSLWNGQAGTFIGGVSVGSPGTRPTMPDWSIDGRTIIYVQPTAAAEWDRDGGSPSGAHHDDDHVFGGSLYTVPYLGSGVFGTPAPFLLSGGENNYYPSYSPDNPTALVLFDRASADLRAGSLAGCIGSGSQVTCPNDSFSNPAARSMLVANAAGSTPIDLEKANGSPATSPIPASNSYPRFAPFVQSYHGQKVVWFTFSSTRDYGIRVLNHKADMYPCYPANSYEQPGVSSSQPFGPHCQEPQLWMAPIVYGDAKGVTADPSGVAFWLPYQDITTHNHTAQWTPTPRRPPPPADSGSCTCSSVSNSPCGPAAGGCGCCPPLVCTGNGVCMNTGPN